MEASGYYSLILCLESAMMRDCVLWSIQRENRIKCIASTELQHWVHVKVIVCRKQYYGYQRQTFHFIIGA